MSYFEKNFLHAVAVLGHLSKLKRILGLAFVVKCFLFNTLYMDKDSISSRFSFSRYQTTCVIKFFILTIDGVTNSKIDRI